MPAPKRRSRLAQWIVLILVLVAAGIVSVGRKPQTRAPLPPREGPALTEAGSWGYQLQGVRPRLIPAGVDMLVVDYSRDGSGEAELTPAMVEALRKGPDGRRRIVLCYISIGEAEDYRYYWWRHWKLKGPGWLGRENKEWKGNYPVRFWYPAWQQIIFDPSPSFLSGLAERYFAWRKPYLDRIMEMGFDGVYLDRVDVFQEWEKSRKGAARDMIRFVGALSAYAKSRKPGFLIVPQNGEELLQSAAYRKSIDGIAKEDLVFGVGGDGSVNDRAELDRSAAFLAKAKAEGRAVFVVEYLKDDEQRQKAQREIEQRGFVPLFAERALDKPPRPVQRLLPLPVPPPASAPDPAAPAPPPPDKKI